VCHFNDAFFNIPENESEILPADTTFIDNKNLKKEVLDLGDNEITIKITNKKLNIGKWIRYKNGKIKKYRFEYENGVAKIQEERFYDENGNVTKTIDHEKGYNLCWAEAIEIVKQKLKNELSKYDSVEYVLQRVDLNEFPNEKPVWSVGIVPEPDDKIGETTYYKIDGVTGKYLGKFTARMVPN
jgi:hypothetical protein